MSGAEQDPWCADLPPGSVAHTPNAAGRWHPLHEHLQQVADLAREFAGKFGADDLAYGAGLLHDLGKYSPEFQQYLLDCHRAKKRGTPPPRPGSAPHKQHGAAVAAQLNYSVLTYIIAGHHGGMPDTAEIREIVREFGERGERLRMEAGAELPELAKPPSLESAIRAWGANAEEAELLIRMVFSCLVDADSLDTEAHTEPGNAATRNKRAPTLEELREKLGESQRQLMEKAPASPLNAIRREVYTACIEKGALRPGVFRLTVPTGGGKTRSSLAFALEHAAFNGLERVIYAIPYTSIVDQTADEFTRILGEDAVLEHHSALEPDDNPRTEWLRRLACQNWDAPLIVTTTVQLFESLYGNRPGRSRKVHRLAKAVLVLDEVQALPPKLLKPLVDGLRRLCERCGTTVLLCTATQPVLDVNVLEQCGLAEATEIVPDPPRLFAELRRVTYDLTPLAAPEGWTWEQAAEAMREVPSCMAVLNTKRDAHALLATLDDPEARHLSTLLCPLHRRAVLAEVRDRLERRVPCRLVATQVVECGCNLDFPRVLRALGPLDRIVQAAGRCNREGERDPEASRVIVFRPATGGKPLGSYAVGCRVADRLLREEVNLHDPQIYDRYFREAFALDDLDARGIQALRRNLDFPQIAERLRLIDEDTVGVLVPYAPAQQLLEALLAEVRARRKMTPDLWRRAQALMVALRRSDWERYQRQGFISEAVPGADTGLWIWSGGYHPILGLVCDAPDPADLII